MRLNRYGVALVGVQSENESTTEIKLNPGPNYVMKSSDVCFYMSISKEENSSVMINKDSNLIDFPEELTITEQFSRRMTFKKAGYASTKIHGGRKKKPSITLLG